MKIIYLSAYYMGLRIAYFYLSLYLLHLSGVVQCKSCSSPTFKCNVLLAVLIDLAHNATSPSKYKEQPPSPLVSQIDLLDGHSASHCTAQWTEAGHVGSELMILSGNALARMRVDFYCSVSHLAGTLLFYGNPHWHRITRSTVRWRVPKLDPEL